MLFRSSSSERVILSVSTADAASESLGVLGASTTEVQQRIEQIALAAEEQSQASSLLGHSMNEIAANIASSAEGAANAARTSDELVRLAHQLESVVSQFRTGSEALQPTSQPRRRAA